MYCKNCGKQIDDDSAFCSFCGTKQSAINIPLTDISKPTETKTVNVNLSFGRNSTAKETVEKVKIEKYDLSYQKETEATVVGIILIIISIVFIAIGGKTDPAIYSFIALLGFVVRIFLIVWCVNIAKRQNRETFTWGLFAFFLPSIALIIIGQNKKLKGILSEGDSSEKNDFNNAITNINPNKLPTFNLQEPSSEIKEALTNDNFTLQHFIKDHKNYIKKYGNLLPLYSCIILNKRGLVFNEELLNSLDEYSRSQNYSSFQELLKHYSE